MDVGAINKAFEKIDQLWSPRIAAEFNGQAVEFARVQGEFVGLIAGGALPCGLSCLC